MSSPWWGPQTACSSCRCVSDAMRVRCQVDQQAVFDRRDVQLGAGALDGAPGQVDAVVAEFDAGGVRVGPGGVPSQMGAHARQQLAHAERLDQVVVGAGVEGFDLVAFVGACRQHEDRRSPPRRAVAGPGRRRRRRADPRSSTSRSGRRVPASIRPRSTVSASCTSKPSRSSERRTKRRISASSSTTRMRGFGSLTPALRARLRPRSPRRWAARRAAGRP